jgi:hypothetical protein
MGLSSGKQSKTSGVIALRRLEAGLFSVDDAYDGAYDFFSSSELFPAEGAGAPERERLWDDHHRSFDDTRKK